MSGTMKRTKSSAGATTMTGAPIMEDVPSKSLRTIDDDQQPSSSNSTEKDVVTVVTSKRVQKGLRIMDNTKLMLIPEPKEETNEKDFLYAQNFMDKVESTYLAERKDEKVTEFENILKSFDPTVEKVTDLYFKMENFFHPDHPELAELFLTFLQPGEAAEVGKFMEHFMLTNMSNFINKLNIFFSKQPAQIRKILTCLKDLSDEKDLKIDQIKSKVLPLLKGNPLLIEWFQQCFPNLPDCSPSEYESLNFHKASESMDETDIYEHIPQTEILPDPIENPCHIRYINGRIYYGNRILLPAKLSFLAVNARDQEEINSAIKKRKSSSSTDVDENLAQRKYRCVHGIKRFGDIKLKEQQRAHFENEFNHCGHNSTDDSDRTDDEFSKALTDGDEKNNSTESLDQSWTCCDDMTLKAHGLRLNPTAHATELIKSSDLLDLLRPSTSTDRLSDAEKELLKTSPKKQCNKNASTAVQRKTLSPNHNAKKPANKSPNSNSRKGTVILPSADSQAVQTAKKLKKLITAGHRKKQKKPISNKQGGKPDRKRKKSARQKLQNVAVPPVSNDCAVEPLKLSDCKTEIDTNIATSVGSSDVKNEPPEPLQSWSRDEDKIVLEQIKIGFTSEDDLVRSLQFDQLPNRSYSEIFERFKFLMDIIANL